MTSFLIKYRKSSGHVEVESFPSMAEATRERLRLDRTNVNPDVEIVTVTSRSEEHLKQSHRRYFAAA